MIGCLLAYFRRGDVSDAWIREQARKEGAEGWQGPRWRFPLEVKEQAKRERLMRIATMRRQGWRKQA